MYWENLKKCVNPKVLHEAHGVYGNECEVLMSKKSMPSMALKKMENCKSLMKALINQMRMTMTTMEIWGNLKWMRNGLNLKMM